MWLCMKTSIECFLLPRHAAVSSRATSRGAYSISNWREGWVGEGVRRDGVGYGRRFCGCCFGVSGGRGSGEIMNAAEPCVLLLGGTSGLRRALFCLQSSFRRIY